MHAGFGNVLLRVLLETLPLASTEQRCQAPESMAREQPVWWWWWRWGLVEVVVEVAMAVAVVAAS